MVLLLFDDLRHDPFNFAGGPVQTPHIDSLARAGIVFHSAMTTTGLCTPSRAALFTGRWGHSTYSYDVLMRIPLIIKAPGYAHREIDRQVSILDINQTVVEWMGLEPFRENLHSRSLFPLIENGDRGWEGSDEAFYHYEWYNGSWFGIHTIRNLGWKYCWHLSDVDELSDLDELSDVDELYDLEKDPGEMVNLAGDPENAEVLSELQQRLLNHLEAIGDPLRTRLEEVMGN